MPCTWTGYGASPPAAYKYRGNEEEKEGGAGGKFLKDKKRGEFVFERREARAKQKKKEEKGGKGKKETRGGRFF
jgi:hypothetical protein